MAQGWLHPGLVKHPGALRAKAKKKGLVKGKEKLSNSDLNSLAKSGDGTTRRQVGLARAFKGMKS